MSGWDSALNVVKTLAPTIASVIGGPLAGGAVTALENVFGITPSPSASIDDRTTQLATAISGATPEQLAAIRKADQDYQVAMAQAGFKDAETLASLAVQDRQGARNMQVSTKSWMPPVIGSAIIIGSLGAAAAILMGKVEYGNTTAATMVGTVIGYLFSESKAVLAFYFGSSQGSEAKTQLLAKAQPVPDDH